MLEAREVRKRVGQREILRGVSLRLLPGSVCALFGPNGAGKSTLLKVMSLLLRPTSGAVLWEGRPVAGRESEVRRRLGVVGHATFLYDSLSAEENLRFYGRLYGVADLARRVGEALELVGLEFFRREPAGTFSRGMQQRLAVARALLHRPAVLLLDEPFTGLDREGQARLAEILERFRVEGGACLLVSHDFDETLAVADRYAVLSRGQVVREGSCRGVVPAEVVRLYQEAVGGVVR